MARQAQLRRQYDEAPAKLPALRPKFELVPVARPRKADIGMHPRVFRLGMLATAWFVVAMATLFTSTLETGYLMAITFLFSTVFFGLTLGFALRVNRESRWSSPPATFDQFIDDEVGVHTGRLKGREALLQLVSLPIALAAGATAIGLVFVLTR